MESINIFKNIVMKMEVEERVKQILDQAGVKYKVLEHEPVYTSQQAADVRGVELKTGVKALVVKTTEERYLMVLVRADKRADLERIARLEKTKKVRLALPEEVKERAGCEIGSVPPFGIKERLKTYMDETILENKEVNFNIGKHTKSINMHAESLKKVVDAVMY
ncbi:MAG: hypothetical protein KKC05_02800 [Nanoarchaeota archaeon]|nr:hypothetical protein [Nanoarchaeota archaeon]